MKVVFDSSALLAIVFGEDGAGVASAALRGGILSAVNASEVIARLVERGNSQDDARKWLRSFSLSIRPFDEALAIEAGFLRLQTRRYGLSLGDRACLALAIRQRATVLTTDRVWARLDLGVEVRLIR